MIESHILNQLLKKALKAKGITYLDVAKHLSMSEAGVKRFFSHNSMTLDRFEKICKLAGVSIEKLAAGIGSEKAQNTHQYTLEQENLFASEPICLALFDLLLNGKTIKDITKVKGISISKTHHLLKKIENVGLIEWMPKDKVKVLVKNVQWRENGPLRRAFLEAAKNEFLNHSFTQKEDFFKFQIFSLTPNSRTALIKELKELLQKYMDISSSENQLGFKLDSIGVVLASRKWNFSILEKVD